MSLISIASIEINNEFLKTSSNTHPLMDVIISMDTGGLPNINTSKDGLDKKCFSSYRKVIIQID